jgi:hypothetical protein
MNVRNQLVLQRENARWEIQESRYGRRHFPIHLSLDTRHRTLAGEGGMISRRRYQRNSKKFAKAFNTFEEKNMTTDFFLFTMLTRRGKYVCDVAMILSTKALKV